MMRRHFHGGAFDDSLDSAGRIRLPKKLIEHAGLGEGPCVIVGSDDWFGIWNVERWAAYEKEMDAEVSDVAENLSYREAGGWDGDRYSSRCGIAGRVGEPYVRAPGTRSRPRDRADRHPRSSSGRDLRRLHVRR